MLGDMLRAERERQNLTIKDIEKGTSIRALYIECIENGDYSQLPGEVYTKGFIRNYANFLKMDADAIVKRFTEENHPEQAAAQAAKEAEQAAEEEVPQKAKVAPAFSTGKDFHQRVESSHKRQNFFLVAVILLVVAAGAFFLLSDSDSPTTAKPAKTATTTAKAPQEKTEKPQQQAAPAKKAEGVEVVAKTTGSCWTQVKADGKVVYEGTLEKGKTETWKGKESVVITAGNAGAIAFNVNGKDLGKAGDIGEVTEKTFTPEGEKSADSKKDSKK